MNENTLRNVIDALYSSYLARDLFAKALPGCVLFVSLLNITGLNHEAKDLIIRSPFAACLLYYCICFGLGFLTQAIGEALHIIRAFPTNESLETFQTRMRDFRIAPLSNELRQQRERYVVIKDLCGNLAISIALSSLIWLLQLCLIQRTAPRIGVTIFHATVIITMALTSSLALWWYHKRHAERQKSWEVICLNSLPDKMPAGAVSTN